MFNVQSATVEVDPTSLAKCVAGNKAINRVDEIISCDIQELVLFYDGVSVTIDGQHHRATVTLVIKDTVALLDVVVLGCYTGGEHFYLTVVDGLPVQKFIALKHDDIIGVNLLVAAAQLAAN